MRWYRITGRIFLIIVLSVFATNVSAYICRNKQTGQQLRGGDSPVVIPLSRQITPGEVIFIDLWKYYECRNEEPYFYDDFMYLEDNGISTVLNKDFEVGAYINGGKYDIPVPYTQIFKLPWHGDGNWHAIPFRVFYKVSETPGYLTRISKGQEIATVRLYKYAHFKGGTESDHPRHFIWKIIAGNDSIFTSGTCAINNGNVISVDFGQIPSWRLSPGAAGSFYKRDITVPYRCKHPITMPIKITLSADASDFSVMPPISRTCVSR
ncbi:hypothetical protein BL250_16055 [Erwinia sp. OLTSP20]|uniref:fimbrial protein n=1 Tax=unclassified Erwinia TaxID=2622719 RepID=UPI000C4ECAB3|nr:MULTISPECIES: fimbrial protein [unclassified Erwinia]PIJ48549.1 hypothetical protein BV501_16625 [Erwinia sp. OAMSP11]PIJ68281.1 hypothetical protein BK416_16610 [Erwinia sp. OLSSP12]PIJ89191.1 hypothetical protein BL250_16055 [Erwinia sp. OLTSP20]PIJ92644.1 hypothetical protein BL249_06060 [Erwinia sp. OLFS4]